MSATLVRRMNVKPIIAVPRGAILPAELEIPIIKEGSFLEKMSENASKQIAIVELTTEELIVLVEKPHLFGVDVIALVGVPGGRYDAVWSSYIAPLRRVSLETLASEARKIVEQEEGIPDRDANASMRLNSTEFASGDPVSDDDSGVTE